MGGVCTHLLISETSGACQLPQPWGDPGKPLKGKRGSVTSLVVADGSSLTMLVKMPAEGGAEIEMELGIRKETEGFSATPMCPPPHLQLQITCPNSDTEDTHYCLLCVYHSCTHLTWGTASSWAPCWPLVPQPHLISLSLGELVGVAKIARIYIF